jgi:adenylate cyclase
MRWAHTRLGAGMSFLAEIKRRKVFQVAAVYAVVAWILVQIATAVEEPLNLPDWADSLVIVLLAIGFPIALIMSWAFDLTAEGLVRDTGSATRGNGRRIEYVAIGLVIVAVIWLIFRVELGGGGRNERDVLPDSIAVLLCDNLSPDPDNAFFAASLHEEILNQLVKLSALNVIGRSSVLQYADAARPSIPEIADALRVESIMECSVSYADDQVAIAAQLIDGETGTHLWSERYYRPFRDVFGIQADIAMNVANALEAEFSLTEQQSIEKQPTDSPEAYALYLRALGFSLPADERLRLLDRALTFDPDFALAYAQKARDYGASIVDSFNEAAGRRDPAEAEALIVENAEKALALDATVGRAHAALAAAYSFTWRWSDALKAYERAYELSPNDDVVLGGYANFLSNTGYPERAIEVSQRRIDLNPGDGSSFMALGQAYAGAGRHEAAREALQTCAESSSPVASLCLAQLASVEDRLGDRDAAARWLNAAEALVQEPISPLFASIIAHGYSVIGRQEDATRMCNRLAELADRRTIGVGVRALCYVAVRDEERALESLTDAVRKAEAHEPDAGYFALITMKLGIANDPLLEQPRFARLLDRLGDLE